ncbi:hypothetical protein GIS00_02450 [Nakamurella sp. YIM 132087]|uniref:Septum formation-related domain-containing protein n=1 Tax=Nakamurella alba TaxID=2665158 RepID=A0A7K1FFA9_9ACTN|nr:hypothetical protein [Nakamurella alba]MTD12805.1 hypothetical protein [Nakamurella alba]
MRRQLVGALVLILACCAVLAGGALLGRDLPGRPSIGPIPGPPAVGDCLTTVVRAHDALADAVGRVPMYRSDVAEPCSGRRVGEVVAVLTDPEPVRTVSVQYPGQGIGQALEDPNERTCSAAAAEYLGLPPDEGMWEAETSVISAVQVIGPSAVQAASGQSWAACVLQNAAAGDAASGFAGSVQGALSRFPALPDLLICEPMPCDGPHRQEYLADANFTAPAVLAEVQASCESYARERTGLAELPEIDGLTVVLITDPDQLAKASRARPALVTCALHANSERLLTGSLLGVGDPARIPWA